MKNSLISLDEFLNFSKKFRSYHPLFMELWTLGDVYANPGIETSTIKRENNGASLSIEVNPDYWDSLSQEQKLTLIAHNCLHEYLDHPTREALLENKEIAVFAADIVANQLLKDCFNFPKEDFPQECTFAEDIFPDELEIKSLEYYYERLLEDQIEPPESSCDSHSDGQEDSEPQEGESDGEDEQDSEGKPKEVSLKDLVSDKTKESLAKNDEIVEAASYGSESSNRTIELKIPIVQAQRKWNVFLKKKFYKTKKGIEEYVSRIQWIRTPRRLACIESEDLVLPSEGRIFDYLPKTKVKVFLDISGSCQAYSQIFAEAAAKIPRRYFDCKFYAFNTRVEEIEVPRSGKSFKIPYGGGTNFYPIVEQVKSEKLPDIIFILTDGDAGRIWIEKKPETWHWFLIKGGYFNEHYTNAIPKECNIHHFEDFSL